MSASDLDSSPYEGSDEASENELLERSLSVWLGWSSYEKEDFTPVPIDLHTASSIGHLETVRSLLQRKNEDMDRRNKGGWTALMYACYIGHFTVVSTIVNAGSDVNVQNHKGQTPLMLAASCGNDSVGDLLCQHGAELESCDLKGWTALFHATYSGHQNMVRFLLEQGANMAAIEPYMGITPFMEAAAEGHEIIVQLFLQHGVNVNAKAYNGDTARSAALVNGHMKIVSLIDNSSVPAFPNTRSEAALITDLSSSSDENTSRTLQNPRAAKNRIKGPSIRDGPEALAKYLDRGKQPQDKPSTNVAVPQGYLTFNCNGLEGDNVVQIRSRDVTSPINPEDHTLSSSGGRDALDGENDDDIDDAFSQTGALTIKSSSSSSGGLAAALGVSRGNSLDSNDEPVNSETICKLCGKPYEKTCTCDNRVIDDELRQCDSHSDRICNKCGNHGDKVCKYCHSDDLNKSNYSNEIKEKSEFDTQKSINDERLAFLNLLNNAISSKPNIPNKPILCPEDRCSMYSPNSSARTLALSNQSENSLQTSGPIRLDSEIGNINNHLITDVLPLPFCSPATQLDAKPDIIPSPFAQPPPPSHHQIIGNVYTSDILSGHQNCNEIQSIEQRPADLETLLNQIGLSKYLPIFSEQDVDLQVFLSLTENDLKEVGVRLFGHRRKMTIAIARWHSNARLSIGNVEQAYANKLEANMQELAVQLHQAYEQIEKLKAQSLQEKELRSVTEGCLMEERAAWQHVRCVTMDTRQRCEELREALSTFRMYHAEAKRRLLPEPDQPAADCQNQPIRTDITNDDSDSLARDVSEILSLGALSSRPANEMSQIPLEILLQTLDYYITELHQTVSIVTVNTERLLGRSTEAASNTVSELTRQQC